MRQHIFSVSLLGRIEDDRVTVHVLYKVEDPLPVGLEGGSGLPEDPHFGSVIVGKEGEARAYTGASRYDDYAGVQFHNV